MCVVLGMLDGADVSAQPADLKPRIDALAAEIRAAAASSPDLKKSLADLRAAIGVLEAKAPNDVDPTLVAIEKTVALTEALKPENNVIGTNPRLYSAISELFTSLEGVESVDFLRAVTRRSDSLTALLGGAGAVPPTSLKAMASIASLETAILAYRKHGDPMVDIVFAEYGDLRDRKSQRRGRQLCDATAAMRKQCQGLTKCTLPATPETALCNSDPASFAPVEHKGAWILFRCVDSLLNVYSPPAMRSMVPSFGNSYWVPLRSSNEEFVCVPPRRADVVDK